MNNIQLAIASLAAAGICEKLNLTEDQFDRFNSIHQRLVQSKFAKNTLTNEDLVNGVIAIFEEYLQGEGL